MKKTIIYMIIASTGFQVLAQEETQTKIKELGITTQGLNLFQINNFGLTFRFGNEKSVWRLNSLNSNFSKRNIFLTDANNINVNLSCSIGKEWRK
ncbi:MAG: hypothetical protein MRY83_13675, partial [Flavobacteriales bacterium]|nr:hypothetical protein [Flavobacteriales bacterium]